MATRIEADRIVFGDERRERVAIDVFHAIWFWFSKRLAARLNPRRSPEDTPNLFVGGSDGYRLEPSADSGIAIEAPSDNQCNQPNGETALRLMQ